MTLTAGVLGLALNTILPSLGGDGSDGRRSDSARERVFAVNIIEVQPSAVTPIIETFGEVLSGRSLQLRAAASGAIVQLSPNFREGSAVSKGELLFQTDPSAATAALRLAETELSEAQAELSEASAALTLSEDELTAARAQLALREQALERQKSLLARRVGTEAALETAELAVSSANQTVLSKRQSVANAKARINRAEIAMSRRIINKDEAERKLNDTSIEAEFDGVISNADTELGALVNVNEQLGNLIDPNSLEVSFRISSAQFANLTNRSDGLSNLALDVDFTGLPQTLTASIERVSASVGDGQTGREIFASLRPEDAAGLRPGDFVTVRISEPEIEGAALLPALAVNSAGQALIVSDDNRLESVDVEILRRQGDDVIVDARGIAGLKLVTKRAPQLGEGIKVEPRITGDTEFKEPKFVLLNDTQKSKLTAAVEANKRMPAQAKESVLARIAEGKLPQENFERLERMAARMDGSTAGTGAVNAESVNAEMVRLAPEEQAKIKAFVEKNDRMPQDVKTRTLENIAKGELPKEMYDRITSRMGG